MMFWKRKTAFTKPLSDKIEVFCRHACFSKISQHKKRFAQFSREKCHRNLLETADLKKTHFTFLLDVAYGSRESHFLKGDVIEIREGTEAGSFLRLLDVVQAYNFHPETILYFVEDDYVHKMGWVDILLEGFTVPKAEYVTLYDHLDKYRFAEYANLTSMLFASASCHWRTTPSTTQTFAVKVKTLMRDQKIHKRYSTGCAISQDHKKFCHLAKKGARLISSVPGFSTHAEPEFASPCTDWERILHV